VAFQLLLHEFVALKQRLRGQQRRWCGNVSKPFVDGTGYWPTWTGDTSHGETASLLMGKVMDDYRTYKDVCNLRIKYISRLVSCTVRLIPGRVS